MTGITRRATSQLRRGDVRSVCSGPFVPRHPSSVWDTRAVGANLADLVRDAARSRPDHPALIAGGRTLSWAQVDASVDVSSAGYLPLIALSAKWEQSFAEAMVGQGDDRQLAMQPSKLSEFITLVREKFEAAAREGEAPVLVTSGGIRPFVRGIVERFRAQTPVLSQGEIHPRARLKTVSSI